MTRASEKDQFYTHPEVAQACSEAYRALLPSLGYGSQSLTYLEPSAGQGAFLAALGGARVLAYDIEPKAPGVREADFLSLSVPIPKLDRDRALVLGNPPFGKKAGLALAFLDRSFLHSDTVGFILPLQFRKYLTQKQVRSDARLVWDQDCPPYAFLLHGEPYDVRCCFQVWTLRPSDLPDLRRRVRPPVSHPDFSMEIYNCVPDRLRHFEGPWDLAILRQGWGEFKLVEREEVDSGRVELSRKKQWLFLQAHRSEALERLRNIDYGALADRNTSVRGFGMADVVEAYCAMSEQIS